MYLKTRILNSIIRSILILPFENLSNQNEDNYLCNSVPIEITHLLSKYKNIKVISYNSVKLLKRVPDLQKNLEIDFILKGSFLKIEEHIRFNIQLINNQNNVCLLSEKLEENTETIFELIDKASIKIVQYLELEFITENERPKIGELAYKNYLKGLEHWNLWNETNINEAINHFKKVIELEPEFSLGYARLSHCYSLLAVIETKNSQRNYSTAKIVALKAIELNNSILEAHLSLALIKLLNDLDILGAYYSLEKSFSINNHSPEVHYYYAFYLIVIGKYKKAIEAIEYALESDPLNVQINSTYGFALSLHGKYDLAERQLKKTLELNPSSIPSYDALIWNYILSEQLEKARELIEQNRLEIFLSPATQTILYHKLGMHEEMEKWKEKLDQLLKKDPSKEYSREASVAYFELGDLKKGMLHFELFYKQKIGFVRALSHPAWKQFRESDKFYIYKKRLKLLTPPTIPSRLKEIEDDTIVINSSTADTISVSKKNLLFIESQSVYCKIIFLNASGILQEKTLRTSLTKIMNESLNLYLYRCHNSFIINTNIPYLIKGNRKELKLFLADYSFEIPVSRTKASEIYEYLTLPI